MNKIVSISEYKGERFEGWEIVTEKNTYVFAVENEQRCCETWGYMDSLDDSKEFIGAELIEVVITDTALNTKVVDFVNSLGRISEYFNTQFVNFNTDKGMFQLVAYNVHEGFYGHKVLLSVDGKITHRNRI